MKEITVTIQFDENRRTIDSGDVFDVLCEHYKGDGILDIKLTEEILQNDSDSEDIQNYFKNILGFKKSDKSITEYE